MTDQKRHWFDGTINLPTIFSVLAAATTVSAFGVGIYNGLEHRVTVLEQDSKYSADNRTAVQSSLDKINDKLDKLNEKFSSNSAANRPEMQRWSK